MKKFLLFCYLSFCFIAQTNITEAQDLPSAKNRAIDSNKNYSTSSLNNQRRNNFIVDGYGGIYLNMDGTILENIGEVKNGIYSNIGSNIRILSIDPKNNQKLYCITKDNKLFKSVDRGRNWIDIKNNIPIDAYLISIFISNVNPNKISIYTDKGIFVTSNAGFSFQKINFKDKIDDFVAHPDDDSILFILSNKKIFVSSDAGNSWIKKFQFKVRKNRDITEMFFINDKEQILIVNTYEELYKYFIGKDSITTISPPRINKNDDIVFFSFYANANEIVLGQANGLLISKDRGLTWKFNEIKTASSNVVFTGVVKDSKTNTYYLSDNLNQMHKITESNNLIPLNYGLLPASNVVDFEINKNSEGLYFNALIQNPHTFQKYNYGVWNSIDSGKSWKPTFIYDHNPPKNYPAEISQKFFKSPLDERVISLIEFNQILESANSGQTWFQLSNINFKFANDNILSRLYDPKDPNLSYFCAGVNEIGLFRFEHSTKNNMNLNVRIGYHEGEAIISSDNSMNIFTRTFKLSTDGGWTWFDKSTSLGKLNDYNLFTSEGNLVNLLYFKKKTLMVAVHPQDYRSTYQLIRSNDLGSTWFPVFSLPNGTFEKTYCTYVNTSNPDFVIVAYLSSRDKKNKLAIKSKTDEKWQVIDSPNLCEINFIKSFESDNSNNIVLGTKCGLYISSDYGINWSELRDIDKKPIEINYLKMGNEWDYEIENIYADNSKQKFNMIEKITGDILIENKLYQQVNISYEGISADEQKNYYRVMEDGIFAIDEQDKETEYLSMKLPLARHVKWRSKNKFQDIIQEVSEIQSYNFNGIEYKNCFKISFEGEHSGRKITGYLINNYEVGTIYTEIDNEGVKQIIRLIKFQTH